MKKFALILLAAASILAGCAGYRQIRVEDLNVRGIKMVALNALQFELDIEVNNPTRSVFEIAGTDLIVYRNDVEFAKITQVEGPQVNILPGTPSSATIVLRAELTDPMQALAAGLNPKNWSPEHFKATGAVWIKKGKISRKIKVQDLPVKDIVQYLK